MTHRHSIESFKEMIRTGARNTRCLLIYKLLTKYKKPKTDKQISAALGSQDPNYARPRITEMIKSGALVEAGETYDTKTQRTVRLVRLAK